MDRDSKLDPAVDENGKLTEIVSGYKDGTKMALAFRMWFAALPPERQKFYTFESGYADTPDVTMFNISDEEEKERFSQFWESV